MSNKPPPKVNNSWEGSQEEISRTWASEEAEGSRYEG